MQNIDVLYFLQPIITIAFSSGFIIYWYLRRRFTLIVFFCSLIAYVGAIACKVVFQALTFNALLAGFRGNLSVLGVYYGVQTVFFEVGGAYLVALWWVSKGKLNAKDSKAYGLGLAFWENAGYIGVVGLFNLLVIYLTLGSGGVIAQELYSNLISSKSSLFYPASQALPLIGFGLVERVTSLLFHFSWGYLCLLSAFLHKRRYVLIALPMGFVDFFVPFANYLGIPIFELFIYVLGLCNFGFTLFVTRRLRQ